MKNKIIVVAICLLLSSCVTLFSKKEYPVQFTSNDKNAVINIADKDYKLPASITVKRSKDSLKLIFKNDSLQKEMYLESRIRPYYYIGNLFFYPPLSFIVDSNSDKKFYYKNNIYIKVQDTSVRFSKIAFSKKIVSIFKPSLNDENGTIKLHFSTPYINNFYFTPKGENGQRSSGFLGISGGLDYFYNKNSFIGIQIDAKTDFGFPIPVPVEYASGERFFSSSKNFSVSNNRKLNKFIYGYGLNYAVNYWNYTNEYYDEINVTNVTINKRFTNRNLGLHLNSYFQVSNNFYIGVVYQPSIINLDFKPKLIYEHSLSLDFAWKVSLFNLKK